jgi:membrane protein
MRSSAGSNPSQPSPPRGLESSAQLRGSGWRQSVVQVRRNAARDRCGTTAVSLAYQSFLALLSTVIALLGLSGLAHMAPSTVHRLADGVSKALPAGASGALTQAISAAASQSFRASLIALIAGLVLALSTASGAVAVLQTALDAAYGRPAGKTPLARRLRALPVLVAAAVLGGLACALLVFGQPVGAEIAGHVGITGTAFVAGWTFVRWVAAVAATSVLLTVCYHGPSHRWRWLSAGGLAATGVFLVACIAASFYVARLGSFGRPYGALAGPVILALWLYLAGLAILIGAELNGESARAPQAGGVVAAEGSKAGAGEPAAGQATSNGAWPDGNGSGWATAAQQALARLASPPAIVRPRAEPSVVLAPATEPAASGRATANQQAAAPLPVGAPGASDRAAGEQPPPLPRRVPGKSLREMRR